MANRTVYPYGTDGELPTSIAIVNDLVTGGANKALSAQMGVALKEMIGSGGSSDFEIGATNSVGIFLVDGSLNIGAKITNDGLEAFNVISGEEV